MRPRKRRQRRSVNTGPSVRVVIGGSYPVVNAGLQHMLRCGGMTVAAVAMSPDDLLRLADRTRPAVAVINAHSGGAWIQVVPRLRSAHPSLPVIALTGHDGAALHARVLSLGCSSVLSMRATQDDFRRAVRGAVRGYGLVEAALLRGVLAGREAPSSQITVPERDILRGLTDGLSNSEVASQLKCSVGTVKNYLRSVFEKLEVSDRTQAVVKAFRMGIID